ncbi:Bacterial alpha-L-rhamnosidase protein [Venustampulla echinocandica]|uniref:Bacterial alpha-L-rhamnosidase protein n=1 Tax=Venustampulla echinocandica TaxID=2656787 RepID=A0A370TAZ5_9HELO|nr:Bacterial alpha-L-rhamnosidase protein [Venustampulla echinocandica]RDL31078.1 Bacterial alpha-L-rhamnosidase protein [Venustampulla echinocandica]
MLFAAFLVTLVAILSQRSTMVTAAGCWRNTACNGPSTPAFSGSWDKYNYSPSSRTVTPKRVRSSSEITFADFHGPASLTGNGSSLIFDFGFEVGGIVTVTYAARGSGSLGLAFSEASNWTGQWSDSSSGSYVPDGAIFANITATSEANYTMPDAKLRGGFRYLTLFTESNGQIEVDITDITLEIAYQPSWSNLRAYQGYFYSNDDLLNKIWYAGAYTLQTNAIPPATGREIVGGGWQNDRNLNDGTTDPTIYVDGSKRDRTVWAGDLAIAVASILVSTGDTEGVRNTLQVLYNDQADNGNLPFAGPGLYIYNSDTYHMATLIGTYDYFLYTNDRDFMSGVWNKYKLAMAYITGKIDKTGSIWVTGTEDWGRVGQGEHNTEAQMLLYKTLTSGSQIATWQGDSALSSNWSSLAATLKKEINSAYWDASVGAFKNSDVDTNVYPEDANSMSLAFGAADSSKYSTISKSLTKNWGPIGAICPELPGNIVGFVESFEIKGHLVAREASRALDLIRRSWGWYLNNPTGTGSTTIEGYLADGTFGYRSQYGYNNDYSYTSHAHGWSTGPTDALTSYVVGLTLTAPGGSSFQIAPQFGDLTHAEAGFMSPLGKFEANWSLIEGGYTVDWSAPGGTSGVLILPAANGKQPTIEVDGKGTMQSQEFDSATQTVTVKVGDGKHRVHVTY